MAVGDIFQVVLRESFIGEEMRNVFYYVHSIDSGFGLPAEELAIAVEFQLVPPIAGVLATAWAAEGVNVVNMGKTFDFKDETFTPNINGVRAGNPTAPFVAWSYRLNRIEPGTRSGAKRFGGLSESDYDGQTADAGVAAAIAVLQAALPNGLLSNGHTFNPVVVKHPVSILVRPTIFYQFTDATFRGVGSQVSRKLPLLS